MPDSTSSIPDRVGFFGGSFDPIHLGHLRLAEEAIRFASLNLLLFCPAFHAPLRDEKPFFSSQQRLDMLYRITEHNPRMDVCRIELEKQKTCFTYETLWKSVPVSQTLNSSSSLVLTNLNSLKNGNLTMSLLKFANSWSFLGQTKKCLPHP